MGTTAKDAAASRLTGAPSWLLTQAALHASQLASEGFANAGARGDHYRLLAVLAEFGPASQAALGRRSCLDRSDVVAAVNELEAGGLVERTPDSSDRRRNVVTITTAGARQLQRLDEVLFGVQDELLARLSAHERGELVRLLTRILDRHEGG